MKHPWNITINEPNETLFVFNLKKIPIVVTINSYNFVLALNLFLF